MCIFLIPHPLPQTHTHTQHTHNTTQTLIDAHVEAKTTDGYTLRLFAVAFTKRVPGQVSKAAYAQAAQVRAIRKKIVDIIKEKVEKNDLKELVKLL